MILLVVPVAELRRQIRSSLEEFGTRILEARTPSEAFCPAAQQRAHTVLVADVSQRQVAVELRRLRPEGQPALLLSNQSAERTREWFPDQSVSVMEMPFAWNEFKVAAACLMRTPQALARPLPVHAEEVFW